MHIIIQYIIKEWLQFTLGMIYTTPPSIHLNTQFYGWSAFFTSQTMHNRFSLIANLLPFYEPWLRNHGCRKLRILLLYYTPFRICICIHGILANIDLVHQFVPETEHFYYLCHSANWWIIHTNPPLKLNTMQLVTPWRYSFLPFSCRPI